MKRIMVLGVLALLIAAVVSMPVSAQTQTSKQTAKPAQISKAKAKEIALQAVPGTVKKVGMETEGGQKVYAVEIATNAGVQDVHIDPVTGKVLRIGEVKAAQQGKGKSATAPSATKVHQTKP